MPRSTKKKKIFHNVAPAAEDTSIVHLLNQVFNIDYYDMIHFSLFFQEKNLMIRRAIISGKNHGINLKHGSPNPGKGDCSFEAVIQNINDRSCYTEKLPMTIDWYRRIWAKDMENRTINTSLNIYSRQEWRDGWEEMQSPGTFERGIF